MSAVLLALFKDYDTAERVRVELVTDGFPTDRVDLTACCEPGRALLEPAESLHGKLAQYFGTLFTLEDERHYADLLADRVESGAATITVHPRGPVETSRAAEILKGCGAMDVAQHDVVHQAFEHAAARYDRPWVRNFWIESTVEADCIYCRLFPGGSH